MKTEVKTTNAPAAIGPYSQAITCGDLIFTSGQLPIDPLAGTFPSDDVEDQTRQSLQNVKAILEAAGSGMEKILKTTVFLRDMNDFGKMNSVYETFFNEGAFPARSAVEVAALPKGAKVEIEAVAAK